MNARRIPLWVAGASGMLAGECLRLVEDHPVFELAGAISREAGRPLRELHPHLSSRLASVAEDAGLAELARDAAAGPVALVLGLPHGRSGELWPRLCERAGAGRAQLTAVDLAADFRLRDPALYARAYGAAHPAPGALADFAYGLPELFPLAERTRAIAAPGCFATALQLACVPAARAGLLDPTEAWHFFGVTGSSGSGSEPKPGTHHPHRSANLWAYGYAGHRHEAELEQALALAGVEPLPPLAFVPHSGPFVRGIHLTAALPLAARGDARAIRAEYAAAYEGCAFVDVLADGVPELRHVVGSNRAALAVHVRGRVLHVMLCLDNLLKGGAGQALQCLNLSFGLPAEAGLARAGLGAIG